MIQAKKKPVPTLYEMELAVARLWGWRTNLIVPNVSWGMGIHECDMLVLSKSNWATEIEIKRSAADLKKDAGKRHGHDSEMIKYLYFAIPDFLLKHETLIPQRAGIITIEPLNSEWTKLRWIARVVRQPETNAKARKWTDRERIVLGRLGCMRIWSMKAKINKLKTSGQELEIKQDA